MHLAYKLVLCRILDQKIDYLPVYFLTWTQVSICVSYQKSSFVCVVMAYLRVRATGESHRHEHPKSVPMSVPRTKNSQGIRSSVTLTSLIVPQGIKVLILMSTNVL